MLLLALAAAAQAHGPQPDPVRANELYQRYCALCHGAEREGHAADHAPSLRAPELWATASPGYLYQAVAWGRPGTAMAAWSDTQGGPLDHDALHILLDWLKSEAGIPAETLSEAPVLGDSANGSRLYAAHCASCHGAQGEGGAGNALGNPVFLATASDSFIQEGIRRGRAGTPMVGRATGWSAPDPARVQPPPLEQAVVNPQGPQAVFERREGRFVPVDEAIGGAA